MELIKNIFNLNFLLIGISAVFCYVVISGCVKSSIKTAAPVPETKSEKIEESKIPVLQVKKKKKPTAEQKAAAKQKAEIKAAQLAKNKAAELKAKKIAISTLKKSLANAKNNPVLQDSERRKIAQVSLEILKKNSLQYNDFSKAKTIVMESKALHLLGRNIEALSVITENRENIILPDKELKRKNKFNRAPSVEAYYLKGEIYLILARKETESIKAKALYKNAIKAYYSVLSLCDANKCPYSTPSVNGFTECRKDMMKRFKIKVEFPPEGME